VHRNSAFWQINCLNWIDFEKFIEERAVMYDGRSQLLGVGFAARVTGGDDLRSPIRCDDTRVIDRYIGRATLKVTHQVTALRHELSDQMVSLCDHFLRVINEAALQGFPCLGESGGVSWR
jgi:hypothetical protein